jgi:HlyD family secretion protein
MMGVGNVSQDKKRRTWVWVIGVLAVIAVIALVAVPKIIENTASEPETGDIEEVFIGDLSASATASGQLEAQQEADLMMSASGQVEQVYVEIGDEVMAGDPLVKIESDALERLLQSAEQTYKIQEANLAELMDGPSSSDVKSAEAAVAGAQAQLEDLLDGPRIEEIDAAQANVRAAEANVWNASEQVDQVLAGATQADIVSAEASLLAAQVQQEAMEEAHQNIVDACFEFPDGSEICPLYGPIEEQVRADKEAADAAYKSAQAQYDALVGDPDVNVLAAARANLAAAQARQDAAQAQLDLLLTGPDEAQIAGAKTQLAQAQASLAALNRGATEEQLTIARAQLEQARIAKEKAEKDLSKATLVAPFDGVVTAVRIVQGELTSGPVVSLVNHHSLEVVLDVDEFDIGYITVGQPAVVSLETWPDEELEGSVVSIAPEAEIGGDIVTFQVHLSLDAGDLPIRSGMTANADLVTANRKDVLLVPNRAISIDRTAGKYYVNLLENDQIDQVEVTIGLRDNRYTEITAGLAVGDRVVIGAVTQGIDFMQGPPSAVQEMNQ